MKNFEKEREQWFLLNAPIGKKFGYPDCCIKEFCNQPPAVLKVSKVTDGDKLRYKAGCINGKFTGFIPCLHHAKQILSGKISIGSLIKGRSPVFLPFPHQW